MSPVRIFGREPALWLTLIATLVRLAGAHWVNLSADQQAVLNAFAAAIAGFIVAAVTHRGQPAAILGLIAGFLALAVGFGFDLTASKQALIMSAAGAIIAMFVRTQVVAPVPAVAPGPVLPGGNLPVD
jgi:hypothetical protein